MLIARKKIEKPRVGCRIDNRILWKALVASRYNDHIKKGKMFDHPQLRGRNAERCCRKRRSGRRLRWCVPGTEGCSAPLGCVRVRSAPLVLNCKWRNVSYSSALARRSLYMLLGEKSPSLSCVNCWILVCIPAAKRR